MYACKIIADSIHYERRLTTFIVTYPRFVHSELMTHRMFSRNSSSSRAIPIEKMIEQVQNDPAGPVWWGKNQSGMQAKEELSGLDLEGAKIRWERARNQMIDSAQLMMSYGVHKQIVNRLLEPWMWITVIISATEYANFFRLRCHPDAQPEIQKIAYMMRDAYDGQTPTEQQAHLPFHDVERDADIPTGELGLVCAARCARVSYLTHEGVRDPQKDVELARRLATSGHWSPFEHVAYAGASGSRYGNFLGWRQLRYDLDPDFIKG